MANSTYVLAIRNRAADLVETVAEFKDPETRYLAAEAAYEELRRPLAVLRRESLIELKGPKWRLSDRALAEKFNLSRGRISQLVRTSLADERARRNYWRRLAAWKAAGREGPQPLPPVVE